MNIACLLAASIFLFCKLQSRADENNELLQVIYAWSWPVVLHVTRSLSWAETEGAGLSIPPHTWNQSLVSSTCVHDLQAVKSEVSRRRKTVRCVGSKSLWFTGSKLLAFLFLKMGQGQDKCLSGLLPYSSLLSSPWRKPLLCFQPVSDNKCK